MNSKTKAWLLAARPKTLPASIGPVLLGASLVTVPVIRANYLILVLTLVCALLLQIGTNLVNDYYDSVRGLDDHNRLGPDRALQMGWLTPKELKNGFLLIFILAFILGIYLMTVGGWPIIAIGLLSIAMAFMYTGGPLPLSYYALGEVLALIFFGPVPVWGTYYLLTNDLSYFPVFVGLIPGFASLALMGINNLRDMHNDKEKGKTTLATTFGEGFGRAIILIGLLISATIPLYFYSKTNNLIFLAPFLMFIINSPNWKIVFNGPINKNLNNVLARTGKFLFLICLATGLGFLKK